MTINKFGRYLSGSSVNEPKKKNKDDSLRIFKQVVDFENRILRNVREGVKQDDVVTKKQLENSINFCILRIKNNTQTINELYKIITNKDVKSIPIVSTGVSTANAAATASAAANISHKNRVLKKKKSLEIMSKWQVVQELHKNARKIFPRRRFIQKGFDDTWQIDLIDMQKYSRYNKGLKYILTCIDTFSKYAWVQAIKSKSANDVTHAMSIILNNNRERKPKNIQSDDGREFFNEKFQVLMRKYNINHYSTYSVMKASIVERLIRTLKNWLWQRFTYNGSYKWSGKTLTDVINRYNNKVHSTIKVAPVTVTQTNANVLLSNVYNFIKVRPKAKYVIGDYVRISKYKSTFSKGYTGNWSTEIFKIVKVNTTYPITYQLQDDRNEPVLGGFYEQELQKVKHSDIYLVEKVLKKKGNKVLVKWLGMNETSWIDKENKINV